MSSMCKREIGEPPQNGDCAHDGRTGKDVTLICKIITIDSNDIYWIAECYGDEPFIIVSQSELLDIGYWGD